MFTASPDERLCQGDIIEGIEVVEAFATPPSALWTVVVLTNDCDIDKPNHSVIQVARVVLLSVVDRGRAGDIRKGRVPAAMMLEAHDALEESFVDFRHIHRVERSRLLEALSKGLRRAAMSEDGRTALLYRLWLYFARRQQPRKEGEAAPVVSTSQPVVPEQDAVAESDS
jgi:hypothetical protein